MQTPAERRLVEIVEDILQRKNQVGEKPVLLNIGTGKTLTFEGRFANSGYSFISDRIDIDDCVQSHPSIGNCYKCSVEKMPMVKSAHYDLAFANYVLEHVEGVKDAAMEIYRVLKPNGIFIGKTGKFYSKQDIVLSTLNISNDDFLNENLSNQKLMHLCTSVR